MPRGASVVRILTAFIALTVGVSASIVEPQGRGSGQGRGNSQGGGRGGLSPAGRGMQGPATGVIVGTVLDGDSESPIPGAVVSLTSPLLRGSPMVAATGRPGGPPTLRVISDGNGRFVFHGLPAGPASLTATQNGYLPGAYGRLQPNGPTRPLTLGVDERRLDVEIRMWQYGAITGRVIDELGEPAVGVTVRPLRTTHVAGALRLTTAATTQTDDRGHYRLSRLTPGRYLVMAPSATTSVSAASVDEYAKFSSAERSAQSLRRSESRGPSPSSSGLGVGAHQIQLSTLGRSLLPPPPGPSGEIYAYQTVYHPSTTSPQGARVIDVTSGNQTNGIDLQLQLARTVRVSGTLRDDAGPLPGMGLRLVPAQHGQMTVTTGFEAATTLSSPDGRFVFLGVPAGQYTVTVQRVPRNRPPIDTSRMTIVGGVASSVSGIIVGGGPQPIPTEPVLWAALPVSVGSADITGLDVLMRPGLTLSGHLIFDGSGTQPTPAQLQRIRISLAALDQGRRVGTQPAYIDEQGRFTTMGYPAGRYFVNAGATASWVVESVSVDGRDGFLEAFDLTDDVSEVTIRYQPASQQPTVSGTVRMPPGRTGDVEAQVIAFPSDVEAWMQTGMSPRRAGRAAVGVDGRYSGLRLPPGSYSIAAVGSDVAVDLQDPVFIEAVARIAVGLTLRPGEQKTQALTVGDVR